MAKKNKVSLESTPATPGDIALARINRFRSDFVAYFREELNANPTNQQIEALHKLQELVWAKIRVSLRKRCSPAERELAKKIGLSIHSGKGLGKDYFAACVVVMFIDIFCPFKGICTATSAKQLEDVLSTQIRRVLNKAQPHVRDRFLVDKGGIYKKSGPSKKSEDFMSKRTANVKADSETSAQTLAGYHEKFMLMVVDEASDVPDAVIDPLETTLTGLCNVALMIGNVTRAHGYFYRSHYDKADRKLWVQLRWNAEESNLDDIVPGLKSQIERIATKYGKDSNAYRINVLGLPPAEERDALLPWEWILAAQDRWSEMDVDPDSDPTILGVDVGAGGDDSAICRRIGGKVVSNETKSTRDTNILADWLNEQIEVHEPDQTIIDSNGLGKSFCDSFRRHYNNDIIELNVGTGSTARGEFGCMRDEMWIDRVRPEFENGRVAIDPHDDDLAMELSSLKVVDWYAKPLRVMSKKKMKSLGLSSPNKADALMHTYVFSGSKAAERAKEHNDAYRARRNTQSVTTWMAY